MSLSPDIVNEPPESVDEGASLESAFADHHRFLKAYLARRIASPQDAEDYAQEVYLRALQFARRENKVGNWRGIFTRIAADLVIDGFRRNRARAADRHVALDSTVDPSDDGVNSPERILQGRQTIRDAERMLEALDPVCRRAFVLVRFQGFSYAEAASALNTSPVAIGRMIERASLHLAKWATRNR